MNDDPYALIEIICGTEMAKARPVRWDVEPVTEESAPIACELCCSQCGNLIIIDLQNDVNKCDICGCAVRSIDSFEAPVGKEDDDSEEMPIMGGECGDANYEDEEIDVDKMIESLNEFIGGDLELED